MGAHLRVRPFLFSNKPHSVEGFVCACGRKLCEAFGESGRAFGCALFILRQFAAGKRPSAARFLPFCRCAAGLHRRILIAYQTGRKETRDDILAEMGKIRPHDDPGHGRVSCARRGLRHTAAHTRLRSRLGARHEHVYLRRVDAVCGHRPSDRRRFAPDDGRYDAARERAPSFLRHFHA